MLKNTAGQKIGAQMVDLDGVAFSGAVTVYVCGDAGTQAVGSVGSGACTHEGNGYHTYAPSQAETNYDLIAFTFVGTGAIPATVQVSTVSELWTASAERTALGLASANLDTQLSGINSKTTNLPASPAAVGSAMTLTSAYDAAKTAATQTSVNAIPTTPLLAENYTAPANSDISAIKAKTDNLPADTNTLLTSTGIKVASIANGAIAAATFAAGALDAVWSVASRTLTAISDSAGITTLLSRIGSALTISGGKVTVGTNDDKNGYALATTPPTEAEIADAVRTELTPELSAVLAMETRMAEQVPTGPVVVLPAPAAGQTIAWVMCYGPSGAIEAGATISIFLTKTTEDGAFDAAAAVLTSDEDGLAQGPIPRGAGHTFKARRGTNGKLYAFAGVDADTLALPTLLGSP